MAQVGGGGGGQRLTGTGLDCAVGLQGSFREMFSELIGETRLPSSLLAQFTRIKVLPRSNSGLENFYSFPVNILAVALRLLPPWVVPDIKQAVA